MKSLLNKILVFVLTASVVFSLLTCVTFAEPENGGSTAGTGTGTTQEEIDSEVQTQDPVTDGFDGKVSGDYAYKDYIAKYADAATPDREIALSGSKPEKVKTKHWYLPLDQYEPWLREWILEQHKEWKTNVYGQCKSWLDAHLQPRAVSRDLDWGVPVPVEGAEGKVLYVWFDAPIGYISNTQELLPKSWETWWKSQDTKLVHFIGKDNIVFHCIVFPSMLKAYGGYILPDNVPANEFLNLEGDKISTSKNWAVWAHEYLKEFPGKQDVLLMYPGPSSSSVWIWFPVIRHNCTKPCFMVVF